jgi:hypothetical protein
MKSPFLPSFFCSAALLAVAVFSTAGHAQSSCSSDGQRAPTALLERFISADCDTCWAMSTLPAASKTEASLDWIVPSPRGDEAALSTAATNDALTRLEALKLPWIAAQANMQLRELLNAPPATRPNLPRVNYVRVAHGLPFNGYIGTSIEFEPGLNLRSNVLTPKKPAPLDHSNGVLAYLVLLETLPAGAEGSNVERNLVRNVLITQWDLNEQLSKPKQDGFKPLFESRPISIPPGVNPDRLRVLGWVQNTKGKVLAMAQSRCAP